MFVEGREIHGIFLVVYLLALIGVGALKARKVKSQADFSLAGRGLPTFVLVGTLLATWIGTGSIFGNAGETFRVGLDAYALPVAGGVGIVVLYFLAARIRRFGQFTIQDILEARFGVGARILGTLTLVIAYLIIVSYQYRAGAAVLGYLWEPLATPADVPGATTPFLAVALVATFVIVYTALAGMFSVAYTDVANGVLMTLGILIAIPVLLSQTGGFDQAVAALSERQSQFLGPQGYGVTDLINVLLPSFLLLIGDANMVQRFFSAKDPGAARRSAAWMLVGVLMLEFAIITVALLGGSLVAQGTIPAPANDGHIVMHVAFHSLGPWLGAMLVATVVAVVVSTADSYLLSPATSLVRDIYQRFISPDAPERRVVLLGRGVVIFIGLLALYLATLSDEFFSVALFAYHDLRSGDHPRVARGLLLEARDERGRDRIDRDGRGCGALVAPHHDYLRRARRRARRGRRRGSHVRGRVDALRRHRRMGNGERHRRGDSRDPPEPRRPGRREPRVPAPQRRAGERVLTARAIRTWFIPQGARNIRLPVGAASPRRRRRRRQPEGGYCELLAG